MQRTWYAVILALMVTAGCAGTSSSVTRTPAAPASVKAANDPAATTAVPPAPVPVPEPPRNPVVRYLKNRGLDFVDMAGLRFSFGKGLVFNPQATKFLQAGFENYSMHKIGFYGRDAGGWKEWNLGGGLLWWYDYHRFKRRPSWGTVRPIEGETHDNLLGYRSYRGERDIGDIGATVHFIVGVGFEIRAFEILDFFGGLAGADLSRDDT